MLYIFVFFFKQKTAYEMRISDWSSDVCSSDLARTYFTSASAEHDAAKAGRSRLPDGNETAQRVATLQQSSEKARLALSQLQAEQTMTDRSMRSEEHTSELQSLMRISYAVFCLQRQNKTTNDTHKGTKKEN